MNTLCGGLTSNYADNSQSSSESPLLSCYKPPADKRSPVIASIFYGEETFNYPKNYDRGTCKRNSVRIINPMLRTIA